MAVSAFTVANIKPSLKVDANQRFIFGLDEFPEPLGSFKLDNIFTPVVGTPSVTNFETRNNTLSGFRWVHTTNSGDTFGSLKLQSFVNAQSTGTDILLFNVDGTVTFDANVFFNGFSISGDLDMNNYKIINLASPTNNTDAATKQYVDNAMGSPFITLTGAVTGSGNGTVNTVLSSNIDAQAQSQIINFNYGQNVLTGLTLNNSTMPGGGVPTKTSLSFKNANNRGFNIRHDSFDVPNPAGVGILYFEGINELSVVYDFMRFSFPSGVPTCTFNANLVFASSISLGASSTIIVPNTQVISFTPGVNNSGILSLRNNTTLSSSQSSNVGLSLTNNNGAGFYLNNQITNTGGSPTYLPGTLSLYGLDSDNVTYSILNIQTGGLFFRELNIFTDTHFQGSFNTFDSGLSCETGSIVAFKGSVNFTGSSTPIFNANINMNSNKIINLLDPTNAQDAATKAYVDSAVDNSFGPNVSLPFVQLNYNWNNTSGSDPFVFNHFLSNTSPFIKQHIYRISTTSGLNTRRWDIFYDLGDPTEPYGEIRFDFTHPLGSPITSTPFRIQTFPTGGTPTSFIFIGGDLDLQTNRIINVADPTNAQDAATKNFVINYVDSAIDSNFGPVVSLPFSQLSFNWSYASSTNPSPYELINTLTDSQESKNFKYKVLTGSREWNHNYTLIGNSDLNGIYEINYKVLSSTFTPLSIAIYPFATSQNLMNINVPVNMGGFEITNALRYRAGTFTNYLELGYDNSNSYSYINLASTSNDRLAFRVNGTGIAAFLATGLFGFGTITPTLAKVQINGGVQNITGEESALRAISALTSVKIELSNTSASGKLYELRSNSDGSFGIFDRTAATNRFLINSSGNVGIGGSNSPNSALQFGNIIANRRVTLWETTNNDHQFYGFGINSSVLRYQVDSTATSHVFYAATSSTTSNELFRISGNGDTLTAGTSYGRRVSGLMTMQGNAVGTTVTTGGTFYKVAGVTTATFLNGLTSSVSNRLTNSSSYSIIAAIDVAITASHNGAGGDEIQFAIYKNGLQVSNSVISGEDGANRYITYDLTTITTMAINDYIELWCSHPANGKIIIVKNLQIKLSTT